MQKITIRKFSPQPSNLIFIDIDGNTEEVFNDKENLKEYIIKLIDVL